MKKSIKLLNAKYQLLKLYKDTKEGSFLKFLVLEQQ